MGRGILQKKSHLHGILLIAQYSLLLGWISGRPDKIIRGKNFTIISTARECFQIFPRLLRGDARYLFRQKFIHGHSHCRSCHLNICQIWFCNTPPGHMTVNNYFLVLEKPKNLKWRNLVQYNSMRFLMTTMAQKLKKNYSNYIKILAHN